MLRVLSWIGVFAGHLEQPSRFRVLLSLSERARCFSRFLAFQPILMMSVQPSHSTTAVLNASWCTGSRRVLCRAYMLFYLHFSDLLPHIFDIGGSSPPPLLRRVGLCCVA